MLYSFFIWRLKQKGTLRGVEYLFALNTFKIVFE